MCPLAPCVWQMSSRYRGFGAGWPQRSACVGRDGGSAGLCSGSRSVPLGCVGPVSTRLIHDWVSARVKTHRLTPCKHAGGAWVLMKPGIL